VIVGAGFCGLATGAALRACGISDFAIVEQGPGVGHFWSKTYDRIHLHSAWHDLPHDGGLRRRYPVYLSRDQLLDYFQSYAELHDLLPHLRLGEEVRRVAYLGPVQAGDGEWLLETSRATLDARFVAIATAVNRLPVIPQLPGREQFRGRVLHSSEYRNPQPFQGQDVLVVGSGNSAAEIAMDLVEGGAKRVRMWVRGPRHVIPLWRMTWMTRVFRWLGQLSPERLDESHRLTFGTPEFERTLAQRERVTSLLGVDLSRFGFRRPEIGALRESLHHGRIPLFDQGAVARIRSGRIGLVDGHARPLRGFAPEGVRLGDAVEAVDAVILATGFEPGLERLLADHEVLLARQRGDRLLPVTDGRSRSTVYPSAFFPGFDPAVTGGLSLGRWGWECGERIAAELEPRLRAQGEAAA
jgi:indole-3-pyruvate monooxygenase